MCLHFGKYLTGLMFHPYSICYNYKLGIYRHSPVQNIRFDLEPSHVAKTVYLRFKSMEQ